MSRRLVYFHGFNSAPDPGSEKIQAIQALGKALDYRVLTPLVRYQHLRGQSADAALNFADGRTLGECLQGCSQVVFAGSSLGGWLAMRLAALYRVQGRLLINPSLQPFATLRHHLSEHMVNFVSGEHYRLPEDFTDQVQALDRCAREFEDSGIPTLVLLDMDDEVLDSAYSLQYCQGWARVHAFEGGSHRFEHIREASPLMHEWLSAL